MSAAREAFVQNDAQTIREALEFLLASEVERRQKAAQNALAALDRLEELAT